MAVGIFQPHKINNKNFQQDYGNITSYKKIYDTINPRNYTNMM